MSNLSDAENFANFRILNRSNYVQSRASFHNYVDALLGYCPAEVAVKSSIETQWYNFCTLAPEASEMVTHPTLPEEITCVFQLLDWDAIHKFIGHDSLLNLVDPFAGLDNNIMRHLQFLLSQHETAILPRVRFISNDKKVTNIDSLNPCANMHLRQGGTYRIYVFSAPYAINDLCITYFNHFNNFILIAQVRDTFLTQNEVACRTEGWFKKLWDEERILIVEGGFASEGGLPYRHREGQQKWLIIFSNKKHVTSLIKPTRKYRISGWHVMAQLSASGYAKAKKRQAQQDRVVVDDA